MTIYILGVCQKIPNSFKSNLYESKYNVDDCVVCIIDHSHLLCVSGEESNQDSTPLDDSEGEKCVLGCYFQYESH